MVSLSLCSAILVLPFIATSVLADDCTRTYTVREGDICDSISSANKASTYQLAAINPAIDSNCDNLWPGQQLCLGTVGCDCQSIYVVQKGDTCDGVAAAHGINSTILWSNNPNIDEECSNIYIGEVLCVGNSVVVPPIPASGIPATTIPSTAANPTATTGPSVTPTSVAAVPTPTGTDGGDDDQLPYCDELY